MTPDEIKNLVKQVIQEELKETKKTIDRIYEDRDILVDIKTRVGTLEDVTKENTARITRMDKNVRTDISDVQNTVQETKDEVSEVVKAVS